MKYQNLIQGKSFIEEELILQKLITMYHIVKRHKAHYSWVNEKIVHQCLNSLFVYFELAITFTLVYSHYSPQNGK